MSTLRQITKLHRCITGLAASEKIRAREALKELAAFRDFTFTVLPQNTMEQMPPLRSADGDARGSSLRWRQWRTWLRWTTKIRTLP